MIEPKERRETQIIIRVTQAELRKIDALRGPMQRATFMRQKSLGESVVSDIPELNARSYSELARVGANLNQFMKQLNSGDSEDMFRSDLVQEVLREVLNFRQAMIGAFDR